MLGGLAEPILVLLIEASYLGKVNAEHLSGAAELLRQGRRDPRLSAASATALALAAHSQTICSGECEEAAAQLASWESRGARFVAAKGSVQIAPLLLDHVDDGGRDALRALSAAERFGAFPYLRWWLRPYAAHVDRLSQTEGGLALVLRVAAGDVDFWLPHLVGLLPDLSAPSRRETLALIRMSAGPKTADLLSGLPGSDVSEARRAILRNSAERLFVRAFGPLAIHRNDWNGPVVPIDKRRLRHLIGLLVANQHRTLTREMALDMLWPDSDPGGSVNNLNQSVFHLRRLLNEGSRDSDRPQYVISTSDAISFDPELVRTDLDEVRQLTKLLRGATTTVGRQQAAENILDLIRGEFLADLRYEDWASGIQMSVTAEVREPLLELAGASPTDIPPHVSLRAAELLTEFDPFDESAHVAMARKLYEVGRRTAARRLITRFAASVEQELDVPTSPDVHQAMLDLGAAKGPNPVH